MEFNLVSNGWQLTFKAKPENGVLSSCPWIYIIENDYLPLFLSTTHLLENMKSDVFLTFLFMLLLCSHQKVWTCAISNIFKYF